MNDLREIVQIVEANSSAISDRIALVEKIKVEIQDELDYLVALRESLQGTRNMLVSKRVSHLRNL